MDAEEVFMTHPAPKAGLNTTSRQPVRIEIRTLPNFVLARGQS
jgi:hypothetical protein